MSKDEQFYLPAEWEHHSATQLHWPVQTNQWSEDLISDLEDMYCNIIEELHFFEVIHLFVEDLAARNRVMNKLSLKAVDLDRLVIHQTRINEIWVRNSGPMFVKNRDGKTVIIKWDQSSISGVEGPAIPEYVAQKYSKTFIEPGIALEATSIDVNGNGAVLISEAVDSNQSKKTISYKTKMTRYLEKYLGVDQIIWIERESTDLNSKGRAQNICRWLNKNTVLTSITDDESHPAYDMLMKNLEMLQSVTLKGDQKLNVEVLELAKVKPAGSISEQTQNELMSYAGFYIANGAVFVPQYSSDSQDKKALDLISKYFSGRRVIPIDCRALVSLSGCGIRGIALPWQEITYQ